MSGRRAVPHSARRATSGAGPPDPGAAFVYLIGNVDDDSCVFYVLGRYVGSVKSAVDV